MYSRKSDLKAIVKASLAAFVASGFLCASLVNACCRNYEEFAAQCRAQGGEPSKNPLTCNARSGGGNSTRTPSYNYEDERRAQEAAAERQRQQAEADRVERERLAAEKRQIDAAFIRDRDAAASMLKGSSGSAMSPLKGLAGTDNSGLKGSAFDTDSTGLKGSGIEAGSEPNSSDRKAILKPAPHTDTSVVDAPNVPSGLSKNLEDAIPRSPSGDRVRKGFQAIQDGDWKAALAWFQDARNQEPGNPGLGRLVDLAEFTLEYRTRAPEVTKNSAPEPSAPLPNKNSIPRSKDGAAIEPGAVEHGDNFFALAVARQMAARARAAAAYKQYVKKHGDRDSLGNARAVQRAYRGEGYTDEELKVQLQQSLLEYRKNYRKNHPNGPADSVGPVPTVEEITLGAYSGPS